ncbi:MAG: hypothetical protein VX554_04105, partial [Candidatus Thermoplasmatota archaeon]|nr:hypothetical protein [Candidatus Thermoplasmatota archaeon]
KYDLRQRPRQQDIYKVLAFMNNYRIPCGGIIYPGPQLKFSCDIQNRQVLAWIPFTWTEQAYDAAPRYFAFIADRLAAIWQALDDGSAGEVAASAEKDAWKYYEAIATPGAVPPEAAEPLVPLPENAVAPPVIPSDLVAEQADASQASPEEELEESTGEESEKRQADLADAMSGDGSIATGAVSEGDYAAGSQSEEVIGEDEGEVAEVDGGDEPKAEELSPSENEESASQPIPIRNLKKILEQKEADD